MTEENLTQFIAETEINELMVASHIFDIEAKLKSFSILNEALNI